MALSREQFIDQQNQLLDEVFAFAPGEHAARLSFEKLAIAIYDHPDRTKPSIWPFQLKYAPFLLGGRQIA